MDLIPVNSTLFYFRLTNLADNDFDLHFDYYENHNETIDIPEEDEPEIEVIPDYIDLDKLLALLVQKHTGGIAGVKMQLDEVSLSGAELYSEMRKSKCKWASLDDDWIDDSYLPHDKSSRVVTLEAQRIRMFKVTINEAVHANVAME